MHSKSNAGARERGAYPSSIEDWFRVLWRRRRGLAIAAVALLAAIGLIGRAQPRVYRSTCSMLFPDGVPAQSFSKRGLDLGLHQEYLQALFADQRLIDSARADAEVRKWKAGAPGAESRRQSAVEFALASLTVTAGPGGKVFYLTCDAHDPALAAVVANAAARKLIDMDTGRDRSAEAAKVASLRDALGRVRTAISAAENELRGDMRAGRAISNEERAQWLAKLTESNEDVIAAHVERVSAQARYETFVNSPGSAPAGLSRREGPRMSRNKLAELRQKLSAAVSTFTPEHYKVQQLQAEVSAALDAASGTDRAMMGALRDEFVVAARREQALSRQHLTTLLAAARVWDPALSNEAARRLEQARSLYESLAAQLEAAEARDEVPKNHIFDAAVPADAPVRPKLALTTPLGLVVGMLLCSLVVLIRDGSRDTEARPLGVYVRPLELASIPKLPKHASTLHRSYAAADEFRSLRESILIWRDSLGDTQPSLSPRGTSLVITGPTTTVGVTTVASNLAVSLARSGRDVLLVDANHHRPGWPGLLAPLGSAADPPILLSLHAASLNGAPQPTDIPGLLILPSNDAVALEGLTQRAAATFLDAALARFDFVIVDAAPVSFTDARIWAHACNGALLVVHAAAPAGDVTAAVLRLGQSGARLAGTVVNSVDLPGRKRMPKLRHTAAAGKDAVA